jgi:hypothetical protein
MPHKNTTEMLLVCRRRTMAQPTNHSDITMALCHKNTSKVNTRMIAEGFDEDERSKTII